MTECSDALLHVHGMNFGYGDRVVFSDFSMCLRRSVTVIQGYSGCGKTTLLLLLAGFLTPTSCLVMPSPDSHMLVLQEDALVPWLTGEQNLFEIAQVHQKRVEENPLFPEVRGYLGRQVAKLSFGQRRMVELLRACSVDRRFMYFDEPFNYLDDRSAQLAWLAIQAAANRAEAVVISTHHHREMLASAEVESLWFRGTPPWAELRP